MDRSDRWDITVYQGKSNAAVSNSAVVLQGGGVKGVLTLPPQKKKQVSSDPHPWPKLSVRPDI